MEGIQQLFHEFSTPDEFEVGYQLELFAWRETESRDRRWRFKLKLREYSRNHRERRRLDPFRLERQREHNRLSMARKRLDAAWREQERAKETDRRRRDRAARRAA